MQTRQQGGAIFAVLFTLALVSGLLGAIFIVTSNTARMSRRSVDRASAVAYGDAVLENMFDQWRQAMISVTDPTDRAEGLSSAQLSSVITPPSSAAISVPANMELVSASVVAATPFMQPMSSASDRPQPENGTRSRLRVRLHYLATAEVRFSGPGGSDIARVQRSFVRAGRNIFDNFFFGTQPEIEFHPGPECYVDGTCYFGGNLYTAHNSLHFLKDVTYLGLHELNYRPNDPTRIGGTTRGTPITTNGLNDNWDPNNPPRPGNEQKLLDTPISSLDPNYLDDPIANDQDSDGNPNNDGFHELIERANPDHPDPLQLDGTNNERLSQSADYRIEVDLNNNVRIYAGTSQTPLLAGDPALAPLTNAVTVNTALRDVRESDIVRTVTVDLERVRVAKEAGNLSVGDDGLLLYVEDTSVGQIATTRIRNSATGATTNVTSNRKRGVKLINGGRLPTGGLTVVSPNLVYIQGDFNSGKNGAVQPPSNTATNYTPPNDTPSPVVTGYERQPAAVVGDAVNILSNNWNDANSTASQSSRVATPTTVNAAIVAGNVPTTGSSYSGGVENFVRFHENWNNRYFTIYGSLALLFTSQQATGTWSRADYTPPPRRWYYDTNLQDRNPPGFRVARVYERGMWVSR